MYIKTIAVIDLETTGLNFPSITELSIIACEREHAEIHHELPRVLHKLSICMDPTIKIDPSATCITGLDNEDLMNCSKFDDKVFLMIYHFLKRLPEPVCLVAHNGTRFDFPILKKEILKSSGGTLADLYCADSLPAFRHIFPKVAKVSPCTYELLSSSFEDRICLDAMDMIEREFDISQTPTKKNSQTINETTPNAKTKVLNMIPRKNCKIKTRNHACRRLNIADNEDIDFPHNEGAFVTHINFRDPPKSYKLQDVYEFLHGHPFLDSHRAESDALGLLQCVVKVGPVFFKYLDENAVLF